MKGLCFCLPSFILMMFPFGLKWDRKNVKVDDRSKRVRNTTVVVESLAEGGLPTRRSSRLVTHDSRSAPQEEEELSNSSSSSEVTIVSQPIFLFFFMAHFSWNGNDIITIFKLVGVKRVHTNKLQNGCW